MKWTVRYSKQTSKFLEKNSIDSQDSDIRKAIKKVVIMENTNINIKKMKGKWKGFYRIRQGDLRIIIRFEAEKKIVFVHRIGWRGNVYK